MTKPKNSPDVKPAEVSKSGKLEKVASSDRYAPVAKGATSAKTADHAPASVAGPGPGPGPGPPTVRRPLGAKEVIPFRWKLLGEAPGAVLTLFKSTEKEDVDAHLIRVQREGYYTDLRVVDIDIKVKQPAPPPALKTAVKRSRKTAKASRKATAKIAKTPRSRAKASSAATGKPSAKKSMAKKTAKTSRKKTTPGKSTRKRSPTKKKKG